MHDYSDEVSLLEEAVSNWKGKIPEFNKGFLEWERDYIFHARTQRGYEVDYDAEMQWGCSPTETLLTSLAGCLAIDVVHFLRKMRSEINNFKITFSGQRQLTPPQYYKTIELIIDISGKGLTSKKVERAISLSQQKYCSVYHSLRRDIEVKIDYRINTEG